MAGLSYKKYLSKQLDEAPSSLGPSPYTQEGYKRTGFPTLGNFYQPIESKMYGADQERYSLDLKENSLNMPEYNGSVFSKVMGTLSNIGKWGVNTPVGRGAMWLGTQMDRIPNGIEGMLENTRDAALASKDGLGAIDTLKAAGTGIKEGLLLQKDYSMARYLEKLAPNNTAWQDVMQGRPFRLAKGLLSSSDNFENQSTDAMRGRSGPQTDPQYAGFANMTNADILGLLFNLKASVAPLKLGRVKVPGAAAEEILSTVERAPARFTVRTAAPAIASDVSRGTSVTDDVLKMAETAKRNSLRFQQTFEANPSDPLTMLQKGIYEAQAGPKYAESAHYAKQLRNAAHNMIARDPAWDFIRQDPQFLKLSTELDDILGAATKPSAQAASGVGGYVPRVTSVEALQARLGRAKAMAADPSLDPFNIGGDMFDDTTNALNKLRGTKVKPFSPLTTTTITKGAQADPTLGRYLQFDGILGNSIPFRGTQDAIKSVMGEGARRALSYSPGTERFLSHFTNRIESSATRGAAQAFDKIDDSRQGSRMAVNNFQARRAKTMSDLYGKGIKLTENQDRALYYASAMSRDFADPKFMQEMSTAFKIPMSELQQMTTMQPLRKWWLKEADNMGTILERMGAIKKIDTDYMPIFTKKEFNPALHVDDMASFGQEFSGLRSFQKSRNAEYVKDLINRGARGELAIDTFTQATDRYASMVANLQRRRNILGGLEDLGLVSREAKDGFKPLSNVLDVNPNDAAVGAQEYFMNERYMPRFRDEIFGYGGGGGLIEGLKKMGQIQNPWKAAVTFFSPKYHTGNLKDDFVRNFVLGDVQAEDMAAAVSRGTSKPYVTGATVQDWVKNDVNGLTQWMYRPGARNVYDLTARESSDLGRAMGISTVQTTDEVAKTANRGIGKTFNTVKDKAEQVQGVFREANFMSGLRNQGNSNLAREIVNQDLINYRDITPFTRDVVRPFVPFATFRMKNPGVALNQLVMNPSHFGWLAQAQKAIQGQDDQLDLPTYYRDKPVLAWKDANGKLQVFDTGLSQFDSHFMIPGARQAEQLRRMPGPLVQLGLGAMTGKDALGNQIAGPKESNWIDSLLFGKTGADGKQYSPGEYKFIIDTLTGEVGDYNVNNPIGQQFSAKFGQVKTFDSKAQALKILLEQNRLRNERLGLYTDTGTYVAPTSDLKKQKFRLR